jgi:hypothetical protein
MTLESRASQASGALRAAVAGVANPPGIGRFRRQRRLAVAGSYAFGALVILLLVAAVMALPIGEGDNAADSTISPATTIPDPTVAPVVVDDPDDVDEPSPGPSVTSPSPGGGDAPSALDDLGDDIVGPTQTTSGLEVTTTTKGEVTTTTKGGVTTTTKGEVTTTTKGGVTTTTKADRAFTAHQQKGSSSDDPPWDFFWGTGSPGDTITIYTVPDYGSTTTTVGANGDWEVKIHFTNPPVNQEFHVKAMNGAGVKHYFTFTWKVEGGAGFTAYQVYGASDENPPYDEFYGTGTPGDTIYVDSSYGAGQTSVSAAGEWEIRVFFPSAPAGKAFDVKVRNGAGEKYYFTFTYTGGGDTWDFTANQQNTESDATPPTVVMWGTGTPGDTITVYSVPDYGSGTTVVDANGDWEISVGFATAPYDEEFQVKAMNGAGQKHYFTFTARDPGGGETWQFTAGQAYGSCSENPPYDDFSGTGTPGEIIQVVSAYGSGQTTVTASGGWAVRVFFPDAVLDESFQVKVKNSTGERFVFGFIWKSS